MTGKRHDRVHYHQDCIGFRGFPQAGQKFLAVRVGPVMEDLLQKKILGRSAVIEVLKSRVLYINGLAKIASVTKEIYLPIEHDQM